MEILGKLLGSSARVKIMRMFLFHEHEIFDAGSIATRTRVQKSHVRKELNALVSMTFVKKKVSKGKTVGWFLNTDFKFINPVRDLLMDPDFLQKDELVARLKHAGKIKLLIVSGVFIQEPESRLDVLIVSDRLRRPLLDQAIKQVEAEIGKELSYAVFNTDEFKYRMSMYDKLLADVFEFPYERLIDSSEFSTLVIKKPL